MYACEDITGVSVSQVEIIRNQFYDKISPEDGPKKHLLKVLIL